MKQLLLISIIISGCSLYKSSDRANFEANPPRAQGTSGFMIQSCSSESVVSPNVARQFVMNISNDETLWKVNFQEQTIFESTVTNGQFCLYKAVDHSKVVNP